MGECMKEFRTRLRKNKETCLDIFEMKGLKKDTAGFVDSKVNKCVGS